MYDGSSTYAGWTIIDAFRTIGWGTSGTTTPTVGASTPPLYADDPKQEGQRRSGTGASQVAVTIYDDGFKFSGLDDPESNATGQNFIYAAFA